MNADNGPTDLGVELCAGKPDLAAIAGNIGQQCRDRAVRQAFLGAAAFRTEPVQRSDRRRPRHVSGTGDGQVGDHVRQQGPVDELAGEVGMAHGRADRPVAVGRVGQGDAGSGAAEVAERDHFACRQSRIGLQCGECRGGVRDQAESLRGCLPFGQPGQFATQGFDRGRAPVCRERDPGRRHRRAAAGDGIAQCPQRVGDKHFAAMEGAVGGHDADRVCLPGPRNPVTTSPRSSSRGFSEGTPTSGGRCGYSVSTDCRVAAAQPGITAAKFVAPTDSPTPCVISRRLSPSPALALPPTTGD